jgi:hypothetical protein
LEGSDCGQRNERGGNRILGQLKTSFITKEILHFFDLLYNEPLFDGVSQRINLRPDVRSEQLESGDGGQSDERCGDRVLGQFQTTFVAKESLNHVSTPLVFQTVT